MESFYLMCGMFSSCLAFYGLVKSYAANPFRPPHFKVTFDVTGKRDPAWEDKIDEWIIGLSDRRHSLSEEVNRILNDWDRQCKDRLRRGVLWKKHRNRLYRQTKRMMLYGDYPMFEFVFKRKQTRYRQCEYERQAYTVEKVVHTMTFSLTELMEIDRTLKDLNYEITRAKYHSKNQRKLMTKELKDRIKIRDNYTCQLCGKYMPDGVGLHIDHIIPIKKGGKSVESNLQVLCDKCNLGKGKR